MGLTTDDLAKLRTVVQEEVQPLAGVVTALENDIKEIYAMLSRMEKQLFPAKAFEKLSVERKSFKINRDLLATAKAAGVVLPR